MKKNDKLYNYLESTGVFANGTKEDILNAKKQYWILVRKEWQYQKRKQCKSYTVFFTPTEYKSLTNAVEGRKRSITGFVKQSALQVARNSSGVDKIIMGRIRESFFEVYNSIEIMNANTKEEQLKEVLVKFVNLEQKVLNLLQ